jgi:VanZ family protein
MSFSSLRKILLRWGPAIIMMGLIYLFSSIPSRPQFPAAGMPVWLTMLRKGGHFFGYALLALVLRHGLQLRGWKGDAAILGFVLLFALGDEFHQSFVLGRNPSSFDIVIDMAGASLALLATHLYMPQKKCSIGTSQ